MGEKWQRALTIIKNLNRPDRIVKRNNINFVKLMKILNNPFNQFRAIHITGTNGKGSVALKTAKILQNAGYRTGLYTSPHLFSFRERIEVDGQQISRQQIADNIIKIDELSMKQNIGVSYFQFMTASGFLYFKNKKCDYVSLQVGLGAKCDTTNVVTPEISVITSIGLDHTELLGPTVQHIAKEKAGIIKKDRPIVLGPAAQGFEVIEQAIINNNSKLFRVQKSSYDPKDFQSENNAIVKKCIEALEFCNSNLKVKEENIETGLLAKQPCRMQKLKSEHIPKGCQGKQIYFDVGHNPSALEKVKQFLEEKNFKKEEVAFVFGTSKKKKFWQSLQQIQQVCDIIYLIEAQHSRACPITELQSYVGQSKYPSKYRCMCDGNIAKTLVYATHDPTYKVLVICGSFFMMPEARGFFEPKLMQHPEENLNEIYQLNQQPNS